MESGVNVPSFASGEASRLPRSQQQKLAAILEAFVNQNAAR
jgi:hypothetical protein